MAVDDAKTSSRGPKQVLDLSSLSFAQGGHFMANTKCTLPEGAVSTPHKGYQEVFIPPLKTKPLEKGERLVPIVEMPVWAQRAFKVRCSHLHLDRNSQRIQGVKFPTLNRVQSRLYQTTMFTDENLLLCAPTGAGKTNVALLTILHEIGKHVNEDGSVNLDKFKVRTSPTLIELLFLIITGHLRRPHEVARAGDGWKLRPAPCRLRHQGG